MSLGESLRFLIRRLESVEEDKKGEKGTETSESGRRTNKKEQEKNKKEPQKNKKGEKFSPEIPGRILS